MTAEQGARLRGALEYFKTAQYFLGLVEQSAAPVTQLHHLKSVAACFLLAAFAMDGKWNP